MRYTLLAGQRVKMCCCDDTHCSCNGLRTISPDTQKYRDKRDQWATVIYDNRNISCSTLVSIRYDDGTEYNIFAEHLTPHELSIKWMRAIQ